MNQRKLEQLFSSARKEAAPAPDADFALGVLRVIERERQPHAVSLWEQLGALFPRLGLAAALVIGLCIAADFCSPAFGQPDLVSGVAQISEQWLFTAKGF